MSLKRCLFHPILVTFCSFTAISHAEVVLDGSLGKSGALPGPDYLIGDELGKLHDGNLFHSFQDFNLQRGESATFSGPGSIDNIISRVTSGNSSYIDGTLRSTIPNADMYFLNPAGVMFGPNAMLDIPNSLYVSTADYLRLGDVGSFNATNPGNSLLTVASPSAFGFLDTSIGKIDVNGSQLWMQKDNMPTFGKTLALVGGDIDITNGNLLSSGGNIHLFGGDIDITNGILRSFGGNIHLFGGDIDITNGILLSSGGNIHLTSVAFHDEVDEVSINPRAISDNDFAEFGSITITDTTEGEANSSRNIGNIDASGSGGGEIYIRAGQFFLDNGYLFADTWAEPDGQGITIQVTENLTLENASRITTETINALKDVNSTGNAGKIDITAKEVSLTAGSQIASTSLQGTSGNAGNIKITAKEKFYAAGHHPFISSIYSSILSNTLSSGTGGNITVKTPELFMDEAATIRADTNGLGDAGNVSLQVGRLILQNAAIVDVSAWGEGQSGNITVQADESVFISGVGAVTAMEPSSEPGQVILKPFLQSSGLLSNTFTQKQGGTIEVSAPLLTIQDYGSIQSGTYGDGVGGNIRLEVGQLNLIKNGLILASSFGSGNAGNIELTANNINLHQARIDAFSKKARGGNLLIQASDFVHFIDSNVQVNAEGLNQNDSGGNIDISQPNFFILQNSPMNASAYGGNGGNITIAAKNFVRSSDSPLNVSSELSIPGQVKTDFETELSDSFMALHPQLLDVTRLLNNRCAGFYKPNSSRFTITIRDTLSPTPENLRTHYYIP